MKKSVEQILNDENNVGRAFTINNSEKAIFKGKWEVIDENGWTEVYNFTGLLSRHRYQFEISDIRSGIHVSQ